MIEKLWKKFVNWETISYLIFGVLTTAVDWIVYTILRHYGLDYRIVTVISWAASVLFAFITNKLIVFRSLELGIQAVLREFISFVACRAATGVFNLVMMIVLVDMAGVNEFISKLFISVIVIILNYIFSKIFIFKKSGEGR